MCQNANFVHTLHCSVSLRNEFFSVINSPLGEYFCLKININLKRNPCKKLLKKPKTWSRKQKGVYFPFYLNVQCERHMQRKGKYTECLCIHMRTPTNISTRDCAMSKHVVALLSRYVHNKVRHTTIVFMLTNETEAIHESPCHCMYTIEVRLEMCTCMYVWEREI